MAGNDTPSSTVGARDVTGRRILDRLVAGRWTGDVGAGGVVSAPARPDAALTRRHRAAPLVLLATLVAMALMAGLFWTWDVSVMPGLARLDDRTFVTTMQALDAAIDNVGFFLALWGALVLYLVTLVVTGAVHLPLNAAISAVDPGAPASVLAGAREAFEGSWRATNPLRTVLCVAAVACLGRAIALPRR